MQDETTKEHQAPRGYTNCPCRDCFEISMDGAFCSDCDDAGCADYQGQPSMSQECQAEGAYS